MKALNQELVKRIFTRNIYSKKQTDIETTKLIFGRRTPSKFGLKPSRKLHKKFGAFVRSVTIWPKIGIDEVSASDSLDAKGAKKKKKNRKEK